MNYPNKIDDVIIECTFEIRFNSYLPSEVILGLLYNKFKDEFPYLEKLPISQLPDIVKENDINILNSPYYKLSNDSFIINIGAKVFSLTNYNKYLGWEKLLPKAKDIFIKLKESEVISDINSFGIRYLDFFENVNIFEKIKLKFELNNKNLLKNKGVFKSEINEDDTFQIIQIANNAMFGNVNKPKHGSIIDINTFTQKIDNNFFDNIEDFFKKIHEKEKSLFFDILNDDFLFSLNPKDENGNPFIKV